MKTRHQDIKFLKDWPPGRPLGPVFRAGQTVYGEVIEPPPGCRGFKGWRVREGSDPFTWAIEDDGIHAVAHGPIHEVEEILRWPF